MMPSKTKDVSSNRKLEGSSFGLKQDTPVHLFLDASQCDQEGSLRVSLRTLIVLFATKMSKCYKQPFKLTFITGKNDVKDDNIRIDLSKETDLSWECRESLPESSSQVSSCLLPALHVPDKRLCVTGLCAVVRFLVKNAVDQVHDKGCERLLGYQGE